MTVPLIPLTNSLIGILLAKSTRHVRHNGEFVPFRAADEGSGTFCHKKV